MAFASQVWENQELQRVVSGKQLDEEDPDEAFGIGLRQVAEVFANAGGVETDTFHEAVSAIKDWDVRLQAVKSTLSRPPAILNNDDPAINCAVEGKIGEKRVRMLLDTGAVRSMIRTEIAQMFLKDPITRDACSDPIALPEPVNCEGAEKGRIIGRVEWCMNIRVSFDVADDPDHSQR